MKAGAESGQITTEARRGNWGVTTDGADGTDGVVQGSKAKTPDANDSWFSPSDAFTLGVKAFLVRRVKGIGL
jgi:hypothetical protein